MKKGLILIAIVVIVVGTYFAIFSGKEKKEEQAATARSEKPPRLAISKNPPAFNSAFASMLTSYYAVKDALVNWDSTKAGEEAKTLHGLAQQLPLSALRGDSNVILTAKNFADAVAAESETLSAAKTIAAKRHSFSTITDNLYSLINTVRYDNEVIYYDKCPMAFNEDEEAYWLSRDSTIVNPYLGNKHPKFKGAMVECGSVEQTVDYAKGK